MKKSFTLIEITTAIVIIIVLSAAGWFLAAKFMKQGRDAKRYADANSIATALQGYYFNHKDYPDPSDKIEILDQSGTLIGYQGIVDDQVLWNWLDVTKLPLDPADKNIYYSYVKAINPWENTKWYEVWTIIEDYRKKENGEKIYEWKYKTPYIISSNTISVCEKWDKMTYPTKISVLNYNTNEYARKKNLPDGKVYLDLLNLKWACQGEVVANIIWLTGRTIPQPEVQSCPDWYFFNGEYCQETCDESHYSKQINGKCYIWTGSSNTWYLYQTKDGVNSLYPLNCKDLLDRKDIFSIYGSITYNQTFTSNFQNWFYRVDIDGEWTGTPRTLYCDMGTDGWGWSRVTNSSYNTSINDLSINTLWIPHTQVYIKDLWSSSDYNVNENPRRNRQAYNLLANDLKLSDNYRYTYPSYVTRGNSNLSQFKTLPASNWKYWGSVSQCYVSTSSLPNKCWKNLIVNLPTWLKLTWFSDRESSPYWKDRVDNSFKIRTQFYVR